MIDNQNETVKQLMSNYEEYRKFLESYSNNVKQALSDLQISNQRFIDQFNRDVKKLMSQNEEE